MNFQDFFDYELEKVLIGINCFSKRFFTKEIKNVHSTTGQCLSTTEKFFCDFIEFLARFPLGQESNRTVFYILQVHLTSFSFHCIKSISVPITL